MHPLQGWGLHLLELTLQILQPPITSSRLQRSKPRAGKVKYPERNPPHKLKQRQTPPVTLWRLRIPHRMIREQPRADVPNAPRMITTPIVPTAPAGNFTNPAIGTMHIPITQITHRKTDSDPSPRSSPRILAESAEKFKLSHYR